MTIQPPRLSKNQQRLFKLLEVPCILVDKVVSELFWPNWDEKQAEQQKKLIEKRQFELLSQLLREIQQLRPERKEEQAN